MKLVADFDGVMTNLNHEAKRVQELVVELWSTSEGNSATPQAWFDRAMQAVVANPESWGWEILGRISAYADEDAFVQTNAIGSWLDTRTPHEPALQTALLKLKASGIDSYKALAQRAYIRMTEEVMSSSLTPIDPETRPALEKLIAIGVDVVITSNSGTDRILDIFKKAGIPACAHPERKAGFVRVRGGARKFELGTSAKLVRMGDREVDIARPVYDGILREELPDAVIGDVFSLDLALPFALASSEPKLFPRGLRALLREREYTPKWSKDLCRSRWQQGTAVLEHVTDLRQLPELFSGLK
jgi:FMN phosphatase YigB (HAD superfamily)